MSPTVIACQFKPGDNVAINDEIDGVVETIICHHLGRVEYNVRYLGGAGQYHINTFQENDLTLVDDTEPPDLLGAMENTEKHWQTLPNVPWLKEKTEETFVPVNVDTEYTITTEGEK
ncbi:MAG: hypothetical protein HOE06_06040 [Candidatus Thioglobus sp.]|nr:hypothetical protein [Candidatus Thioglobus sp.]